MDMKILKDEKNVLEIELNSVTLAEILRVYLDKDSSVDFVAWKRDHPTHDPFLKIEGKHPKKSLKDAVSDITKDLEGVEKEFSSMK